MKTSTHRQWQGKSVAKLRASEKDETAETRNAGGVSGVTDWEFHCDSCAQREVYPGEQAALDALAFHKC